MRVVLELYLTLPPEQGIRFPPQMGTYLPEKLWDLHSLFRLLLSRCLLVSLACPKCMMNGLMSSYRHRFTLERMNKKIERFEEENPDSHIDAKGLPPVHRGFRFVI